MRKGLISILGLIVLVAVILILFFVIGAIIWNYWWLIVVIAAVLLLFDLLIGPRYVRGYKTSVTIQSGKIKPCKNGFILKNGVCVPK